MATAVPYLPPLCHLSRESRDPGMRPTDRGPRSLPDVPRSRGPLTAWKLRYKASSMRDVDSIVIHPTPCIACLSALTRIRFVFKVLHSIVARLKPIIPIASLSPAHHVIVGRESSPHPSRCSRRVVRAHTTATTPALTRAGQVWRRRTFIRERRAHTCTHMEGMLYISHCPPHDTKSCRFYSVLSSQASLQSSLLVYLSYCLRLRRRTSSPSIHRRHHHCRPYSPRL